MGGSTSSSASNSGCALAHGPARILAFMARRTEPPSSTRQEIVGYWPDVAFQHYVLARVGMRSGYWYAAAGCAHFAVELIVKYTLVLPEPWYRQTWPNRGRVYSSQTLPRHHDLVRLWKLMEIAHPGHPLTDFQTFIEELDRWHQLRYAEHLQHGSTSFSRTLEDVALNRTANAQHDHDAYGLDIRELDRFFRAIFDYCNITPALRGGQFLVAEGRHLYEDVNEFAIR